MKQFLCAGLERDAFGEIFFLPLGDERQPFLDRQRQMIGVDERLHVGQVVFAAVKPCVGIQTEWKAIPAEQIGVHAVTDDLAVNEQSVQIEDDGFFHGCAS